MKKSNIKYLLPYCQDKLVGDVSFFRRQFGVKYKDPTHCFARIWKNSYDHWEHTYMCIAMNTSIEFIGFPYIDEAKQNLDKHLIKEGFYLIKEDEVERFERKLKLLI